jgi:hypothetical protein
MSSRAAVKTGRPRASPVFLFLGHMKAFAQRRSPTRAAPALAEGYPIKATTAAGSSMPVTG